MIFYTNSQTENVYINGLYENRFVTDYVRRYLRKKTNDKSVSVLLVFIEIWHHYLLIIIIYLVWVERPT